MQSSRRVVFNPTSIPGLRPPRPRQEFYNSGQISRLGFRNSLERSGGWGSIRKATSQAGNDKSGHIVAHANEGILFFDSESRMSLLSQELI